jgi:hypothetical protein
MGTIQQKWQEKQSRVEDGIFFGSDEFIPLDGEPAVGYWVGVRQPVETVISSSPKAWGQLIQTVTVSDETRDLSIHAGETSWEGEGFVAAVRASTGQLLWLFHLSASEPFVEVETDGAFIRAVSDGYPMRYRWSIPIHAPETFTVERSRAA